MKKIDAGKGRFMSLFDEKDDLCLYCSYPLSEDENPNFKGQCYSCNSIAKSIRNSPPESIMKDIKIRPYPFESLICLGEYYRLKESLKESKDPTHLLSLCLIHYKDNPDNAVVFANLLGERIKRFIKDNSLERENILICGVPDSESKKHQKINLLCQKLSKKIGIIYLPLLKKIKEVSQHKTEKIQERYENVYGAYVIDENFQSKINGKFIFLIDDIVSTMASAYECSKKLKEGGVEEIYVFALGRNIFLPKGENKK